MTGNMKDLKDTKLDKNEQESTSQDSKQGDKSDINSQDTNRLFADAPMLPLMMKMAAPSIMAQLVNMLYSIVDRIYIGHIPGVGSHALAGIGVCNTIIIVVAAFAQFVGEK